MGKKEDEIQDKLEKLEAEIRVEEQASVAKKDASEAGESRVATSKDAELTTGQDTASSDMLLVADPDSAWLDPFTEHTTLNINPPVVRTATPALTQLPPLTT